jgi:hypothetical protein
VIETAFIVLYGLAFIGGSFLSIVWGRVAWRARCLTWPKSADQFCLIATGLCIGSVANVTIFGTRTASGLIYGVDPAITHQPLAAVIIVGLCMMAVSKALLMWAHDPQHKARSWRWFAALSAAWVLLSPVWLLGWRGI